MTEMEKMKKLGEAIKKDLEVCDRYRKLMGSDNITEDAEKRISYLSVMEHSIEFAITIFDFWRNLIAEVKEKGFDESDVRRIKFYVKNHLEEDE